MSAPGLALTPETIDKLADYFELLQAIADEVGLENDKQAILEETSSGGSKGT
jgi:hypothetical protein